MERKPDNDSCSTVGDRWKARWSYISDTTLKWLPELHELTQALDSISTDLKEAWRSKRCLKIRRGHVKHVLNKNPIDWSTKAPLCLPLLRSENDDTWDQAIQSESQSGVPTLHELWCVLPRPTWLWPLANPLPLKGLVREGRDKHTVKTQENTQLPPLWYSIITKQAYFMIVKNYKQNYWHQSTNHRIYNPPESSWGVSTP